MPFLSKIPDNTRIPIDNISITPSKSSKNLGIQFDNYMQFDIHINEISKKVYGTLMYINRIKDQLNLNARITAIKSLVNSKINYGSKVWGTTNDTQLQQVQKLQNFAAKVAIGDAKKYDHVTPLLNKLEWLKIKQKYQYELAPTAFLTMSKHFPSWLCILPTINDIAYASTRERGHLFIPKANTCIGS